MDRTTKKPGLAEMGDGGEGLALLLKPKKKGAAPGATREDLEAEAENFFDAFDRRDARAFVTSFSRMAEMCADAGPLEDEEAEGDEFDDDEGEIDFDEDDEDY